MNKRILPFALAALMLLATPLIGFAAGKASQEIATATTHAQMAAAAADTATAVMHFHHVINCLVGVKSKHFDANVGNPCKDMGNGALNDVKKTSLEHAKLMHALVLAEQALHADTLKATRQYAARITKALTSTDPDMN